MLQLEKQFDRKDRILLRKPNGPGVGGMQGLRLALPTPECKRSWWKMFSSYYVYFGLLFAASCSGLICVQGNFSVGSDSSPYKCRTNLICLGDAHIGDPDGKFVGKLSLIHELGRFTSGRSGIAYYNQPIRMLDSSTRQSASFNTSFAFAEVPEVLNQNVYVGGDGIAFVISADNSTVGAGGATLGFFRNDGTNSFKSIVVEFDNYYNPEAPMNDIGWNHVSLDFMNITAATAKNATDVNIVFWDSPMIYAWVEYSADMEQLEVRISNLNSRPVNPFLSYTVDLFDVVDEYMWVGFSGGNAGFYSNYYIGDWNFESYGIPAAPYHPVPIAPYRLAPTAPYPPVPTAPSFPVPTPTEARGGRSKMGIILGILVGIPVLLAIIGIFIFYFVRWRRGTAGLLARGHWYPKGQSDSEDPMLQLAGMAEGYQFSYKQLRMATGAFSEESKLGQGGFGSVYRGVLPTSRTPVAVKKISGGSNQGEKEFMAEVLIISKLRHRNLIQLLGWCKDKAKYMIVYELMPNGSLDQALFGLHAKHNALSWPQRFNIVRGTAAGLDYLHQGWKQQVIHRDIKSSNIMLDAEWNAKLGDFGLARLVDHQRTSPATTLVAGTYGYLAPEALASGKFTDKTDVFAFGAVALEIACGRQSIVSDMPNDEVVLVDWVWQRFSEGDLLSVVDRRLDNYDAHWMEVVLLMGLLCSHPDPLARPAMRHVVQVLAGDAPVPSISASKPAAVFMTMSRSNSVSFRD